MNGNLKSCQIGSSEKICTDEGEDQFDRDSSLLHLVPQHPLNVKPSGNALIEDESNRKAYEAYISSSLGHFAVLPHDLTISIFGLLSAKDLARLEQTSSAFRSFASHETLWKEALIEITGGHLKCWKGSWKLTYKSHLSLKRKRRESQNFNFSNFVSNGLTKFKQKKLYSDALYLPMQLASLPLHQYTPTGKKLEAFKRITRVSMKEMNKEEFLNKFARRSLPCLLTDEDDEILPKWTIDDLKHLYPNRRIRAEALTMSMETYADYAKTCREWEKRRKDWVPDESPFYLFDPTLARKLQKDNLFVVPKLFRSEKDKDARNKGSIASEWDLFSLLHDRRPDHVWIIAGPKRSGSGWHVDPNHTSAYNTVLSGSKLWMLLPPDKIPPGVFISSDGGTVTAPLSIAEWLIDFWRPCLKQHGCKAGGDGSLIVDICGPGETIYVPAGWKHLVINLEESVAFTQNFVSPAELPSVLNFLKNRSDQISGFRMRKSKTNIIPNDEEDEISEPEFDTLPDGGIKEKNRIYNLFVERLASFDANLLESGLSALRDIEEERNNKFQPINVPHRIRNGDGDVISTNNLWKTLKTNGEGAKTQHKPLFEIDEDQLGDLPW